ncbi:MAG: 50S ribosomal protein L17, partial [Desulfobacterales bacterium]|nr:50S ribosomal protein L17 [Desulfobacterales bacterium]
HLITLAKRGDLHARRQALSIIREKDVVHKLFSEVSERFGAMLGGYTRIVKLGRRPGDAALVSMIEFVTSEKSKKKKTKVPQSPAVKKKQVAVEKAKPEKKEEKLIEKIAEEKSAGPEEDIDKKADEMEAAPESPESEGPPSEKDKAKDDMENTEPEK